MVIKLDMRKYDGIDRMVIEDARKIYNFVNSFSVKNGGIHSDEFIDKISNDIKLTILKKYKLVKK